MPIITISRGSGSGGRFLAEALSKKLGFTAISREDVVHQAAGFGVSEKDLRIALLKPPNLWSRFGHQRRRYLAFVQAALCERVKNGRTVYHGNAGHLLLPGVAHVLNIRLIATEEFRVRMLLERSEMDEAEALAFIHRVDEERQAWSAFLYGVNCLDPSVYDLSINIKTMNLDDAVDLVSLAARSERFQPTPESKRTMENLVISSRVTAALAKDHRTAGVELGVSAADGVVSLRGKVRPASLMDTILEVVASVEGVEEVDHTDLGAPDYTV